MDLSKLTQEEMANYFNSNKLAETNNKQNAINDSLNAIDKIKEASVIPEVVNPNLNISNTQPAIPVIQSLGEINRNTPSQTENYWEVTNLPSKSYFYSGKKVMARPLNVTEVKLLASINEDNVNIIINQVLEKVLKGITVNELLVADKLYIIFWLRANTYKDDGYKVEYDCLECGKTSEYEFTLDMLNVENIKEKYINIKEMIAPSGWTFKIKYLRVTDENKVSKFLNNYKGSEKFDEDILGLANMIEEINNEQMSLLQKYSFISDPKKCTATDYAYIESFVRHIDFGVDPIMNIKCEKCGGMSPVAISFRSDFFIPKYTFE